MTCTPDGCTTDRCVCPPEPFDYHDCGDLDCPASGGGLAAPPADYTEEQVIAYIQAFHAQPCPPKTGERYSVTVQTQPVSDAVRDLLHMLTPKGNI